jgi:hypothetical protein
MEIIFLLLLLFTFVILYVIPAIVIIGVSALVIKWIISKFSTYGEPNDDDDYNHTCYICGDNDDWCRHAP